MKFNLELGNENGTISLSLNREFSDLEIQSITTYLAAVLKGDQSSNQIIIAPQPADTHKYYLTFGHIDSKIEAIRQVRAHLGVGLKEAKDIVEGTMKMPSIDSGTTRVLANALKLNGIRNFEVLQAFETSNW